MHNLIQDFIYAVRGFRKRIGLALLAIVTLALGIGLTTAMFGITNGFLLNGLPFEEGDRIFAIVRNTSSLGTFLQTVPVRDYSDWEERQRTFEGIAAFTIATFNVSGGDRPERVLGAEMTASAFQVLRESPVLGRPFTAEDEIPGAARVAIIAHALWQDRYELDPGVIGNTIRVDGYESTIIGVMGEGFEFPFSQRVWTPLRLDPLNAGPDEGQLRVFGRLADGVSLSETQAEFDAIAANLAQEHPQTHEGITIAIRPYVEQFVGPNARPLLFLMLGLVSLVLLIACSNVANLLLARAVARHREVAIRTALGAHRARLMTSHLIEAFVLVLLGGVGGFAVAQTGIMLFYNAITVNVRPFWLEARVEPEVLLFVGVVMLVATLVSGALPALRASKTNVADVLRDEARGSSGLRLGRLSRWLVTGEIAASGALLVGAGLMVKSLANFTSFQYDFTTEKIFTASVAAGDGDFDSEEQQLQFLEDLEVRVTALPGVVSAGIATELPVIGLALAPYEIEGTAFTNDQDRPSTRLVAASPGMFETFEVPLLEGRAFTAGDRESTVRVALVNASFAARDFAGESPVGRRFRIHTPAGDPEWITIVGVVADMYLAEDYSLAHPAAVYVPLRQGDIVRGASGFFAMTLTARTGGDPTAITPRVREELASLNPNIPLSREFAFDRVLAQTYVGIVTVGSTFAVFGLVALFLAAVGLYGVMSFSTGQRTREIGIRMAFGAVRRDTFLLVLKQASKQLAIGLGAGLALGYGLSHALQFVLFEVEPLQPAILISVGVMLAVVAFLATLVPARRAARVDPMVAMRYE
jgi:putative ABC transport system permease protein